MVSASRVTPQFDSPYTELLGSIHLTQTFLYYDGPRLFACQDNTGRIYLSVWIDEDLIHDEWLLAPVSQDRFSLLRAGQIDLRTLFTDPDGGFAYRVSIDKKSGKADATKVIPGTLDDSSLPQPGQYLTPPRSDAVRAAAFEVEQIVQRRNQPEEVGVVRKVRWNSQTDDWEYSVQFRGQIRAVPESALQHFRAIRTPWDALREGQFSGVDYFVSTLTFHRLRNPPARIANSFATARTLFYPHQFKPLLKFRTILGNAYSSQMMLASVSPQEMRSAARRPPQRPFLFKNLPSKVGKA
jgi:hypothetical protein